MSSQCIRLDGCGRENRSSDSRNTQVDIKDMITKEYINPSI